MITIFDCDVVENGDDDVDVERYLLLYCLPGVGVGAAGLLSLRLVNQVYHHYHLHHHHHHHHEGNTHDGRGNSVAVSAILKTSRSRIQTIPPPLLQLPKLSVFAMLINVRASLTFIPNLPQLKFHSI